MPHHVKIVPARLRYYDPDLGCARRRVIGYRAVCECGEYSRVQATVRLAREWRAEHLMVSEHGATTRSRE
jgi:hypothetical protein